MCPFLPPLFLFLAATFKIKWHEMHESGTRCLLIHSHKPLGLRIRRDLGLFLQFLCERQMSSVAGDLNLGLNVVVMVGVHTTWLQIVGIYYSSRCSGGKNNDLGHCPGG